MSSILSAISGHFGKSIILGAFFPAAIFMVLWLIFIEPLFPAEASPLALLEALDTGWQFFSITFLTVVLTGLLYSLNVPIIRFYEGYPWKESALGKRKIERKKRDFHQVNARFSGLRTLVRAVLKLPEYDGKGAELKELRNLRDVYWRQLKREYPDDEARLLPTRLGNVIRSFEVYPKEQYGVDAVTLWPHLLSAIPSDFAAALQDTKTSFDFMLHSSALSGLLALASLFIGLFFPAQGLADLEKVMVWLAQVVAFALLAYVFYGLSIARAASWGGYVKGAFDLYRWALLEKLGYSQKPKNRAEEYPVWEDISVRMIYGYDPEYPPIPYVAPAPTAPVEPRLQYRGAAEALSLARGVLKDEAGPGLSVVLEIANSHARETAKEVVMVDRLPEGFEYQWGSAGLSAWRARSASRKARPGRRGALSASGKVEVRGANPYEFRVGDLRPGGRLRLVYRMLPRKQ